MKMHSIAVTGAALLFAGAAVAGPQCTEAPEADWLSQNAMKQKLADQGYTVDRFKVTDGSCYEIYGKDKKGVKVEIYFNPVNGEIVEEHRNE
ncbi:PepSY domain-containing protein [Halomonas cibimaris]|uniref:PepSY domain-containing protein n=1 Tax=Halomonas cibimaris TaxID=657012 RepID=A0ABP7LEW7_9GAMM